MGAIFTGGQIGKMGLLVVVSFLPFISGNGCCPEDDGWLFLKPVAKIQKKSTSGFPERLKTIFGQPYGCRFCRPPFPRLAGVLGHGRLCS
jgi:hypothetical protein